MSKEKTTEEVRQEFLSHIRMLVHYWDRLEKDTTKEKLTGLAFSILSALDGCDAGLPSFIVAPCPHPNDKQYRIDNDEDYYPENHEVEVKCDIAGSLHDLFYKK